MTQYKLGAVEFAFAALIWDHEPLTSSQLVELCGERLSWKKSTTYTVLRRLCQRGLFQNEGGVVTSRLSRQEFDALRSQEFLDQTFDDSLPRFLTAFASRKKLSSEEIAELQRLIDENRG